MDYDAFSYIDQQAENYISLKRLLSEHGITFEDALQKSTEFREEYYHVCDKYNIGTHPLVRLCFDLIERLNQSPNNQELQYLYVCTVTDTGLLYPIYGMEQTGEQAVRNYFQQSNKVEELIAFIKRESKCWEQLRQIVTNLKYTNPGESDDLQEFQTLLSLTNEHTFLYGAAKNQIYRENLHALLLHINGNEKLKSMKPYLLFAMLSRKHGMMQSRAHFIPNLKTAFQYQNYQIYADNGKNFDLYQSYLELYDHLRRTYEDDDNIDIPLCDFCFANYSPLSEWYDLYCQPDMEIPMRLKQKVQSLKALSFPALCCYEDYGDCDVSGFEAVHPDVCQTWDMVIDEAVTERFLQALYHEEDIAAVAEKLPYYKDYPRYAELFLYASAERMLEEKMLNIADILAK